MVAIGIAAWSMASTISKPPATIDMSSETDSNPGGEKPTDAVASGVGASSSSEQQSSSSVSAVSSEPTKETTAPVASFYVLPVTGDILKDFSSTELKYSLTYGDMRLHEGIDIAAAAGSAVNAAGAGKVTEIKKDTFWGTMIVIDHGNGIIGYYCGLADKTAVKVGQNLDAGAKLGALGTIPCESLDPPHLHLAFKKDGKYVSPLGLVNMDAGN